MSILNPYNYILPFINTLTLLIPSLLIISLWGFAYLLICLSLHDVYFDKKREQVRNIGIVNGDVKIYYWIYGLGNIVGEFKLIIS